ncbi:glutathione S-transferase 1-like [Scaptodrosophila lebanonensis]|uniref:Glutathione S-transferase 1-like n=1 Tax=Drosophila lebanonensis TaxID=7225 RepID=A0A6J2U196_DROLE|nr:glutathione S-transferase 1-like [Scaptodrosophila lebanonensis]
MLKLKLYGLDLSPPVRAVFLTLKALGLPYDYIPVDLLSKEHMSAQYLQKNPQHTVPTLEDNGQFIWDSHAIMAYLVRKYGKDDSLYPKDPILRAIVDQRLHFESGVVFTGALRSITTPLLFSGRTEIPKERIDAIAEVYDFMEEFLKHHNYIAGNHLTIADFSLISSITSLVAFLDIEVVKYSQIVAWMRRLEQLPYYEEANGSGATKLVAELKNANFTILP